MQEINTLMQAFEVVKQNSYFIVFLLIILGGPMVSAGAAFAASLGYFNIYLIFLLSFVGRFIPDLVYFSIGKSGSKPLIKKLERKYGEERINKLIKKFDKNKRKTLVSIKLTPFASPPGIILSGLMGIRIKSFLIINLLVTFIISGVFVMAGYYFGVIFDALAKYLNLAAGIIVCVIIISMAYPFITRKIKELRKSFLP